MHIRPGVFFAIIWIVWLLSWVAAAAFWKAPPQKRVARRDAWISQLLVIAGAVLLFHSTRRLLNEPQLWHVGYGGGDALAGVALLGVLFAWWARIHLGRLWSGIITIKQDHRVVDTGPYGLVRHPIYTGLIVSILATAAAQATVTGLIGAAAIVAGLYVKARIEERFLTTELGADAYDSYRRRVPMLVPFLPAG
jgi:protein-S-isoprenylcysteine O-methyltransferase Ste14